MVNITRSKKRKLRLLYVVDHPIQYQAQLLALISNDPDIELFVIFESISTSDNFFDKGFDLDIKWDINLTDGYSYCLAKNKDLVSAKLLNSDILWIHGWNSSFKRKLIRLGKKNNIPVLMRGENTLAAMPKEWGIKGFLKQRYLQKIFEDCDGFLCIGKENRDYYKAYGVLEKKLFQMPYTVDNAFFQKHSFIASKQNNLIRNELGIEGGCPIVLFVGKLIPRKKPDLLIEAFISLDHEKLNKPYLLLIGDGQMRSELTSKAYDFKDRIKFVGFKNQTELPAYYELADIFVLPSEREPWGLVINEAMNCGTAIITTEQCGAASDLIDSTCGYVIPAGTEKVLSNTLKECLEDLDRCNEMGKNSKQKISGWGFKESIDGLKEAIRTLKSGQTCFPF